MSDETIHSRLEGVAPPAPPERLRAAALGAAERSWGARPDLWTRLWESRSARLAWAAAVLALLASHLLLSASSPRAAVGAAPATLAEADAAELIEIADVRKIRIENFSWITEGPSLRSTAGARRALPANKEPS